MHHVWLFKIGDGPEPVACEVKTILLLTVGHNDEDDRQDECQDQDGARNQRGLTAPVRRMRLVQKIVENNWHVFKFKL